MKKLLTLGLGLLLTFSLASCGGTETPVDDTEKTATGYLNSETPVIFSTTTPDRLFNPFFSTSAADGNLIGMTQITMLGNDKDGKISYGEDDDVVTLDLEETYDATADITTYSFVLKNDVRFSNGSYLTMKDVLFNLYVYLDEVYTGSSTIYSNDIVGLQAYRTQQEDEEEQKKFNEQFEQEANQRINNLIQADLAMNLRPSTSYSVYRTNLQAYATENSGMEHADKLVSDYEKAYELFQAELNTDYSNNRDTADDIIFLKDDGSTSTHKLTTDVEAFLYAEGYITYDKKTDELATSLALTVNELKSWTEEQAIRSVLNDKFPSALSEIISYWATATELQTYIINQAKEEYFGSQTEGAINSISGIKFANMNAPVTVNGKEYPAVTNYTEGGQAVQNEVLQIQINGIDPKAIWNFAFQVAPMYYYSNEEEIAKFDYVNHFGVTRGSSTFMNTVVNSTEKNGVPVGAGAYMASNSSHATSGITAGSFYVNGVAYYTANPYFVMGEPALKYIHYAAIADNQLINSLRTGSVDFIQPNASTENTASLEELASKGNYGTASVQTSGYGYIGVNASKVPSMAVRQAIMHSINTSLTVQYYGDTARALYRSMSYESWAYPKGATPYYPYIGGTVPAVLTNVNPYYREFVQTNNIASGATFTAAQQEAFIKGLVESDGYTLDDNGVYSNSRGQLKYDFTIAGATTDHPAWNALYQAGNLLNKYGFNITVKTNANALQLLSTGDLAVWAAAWSSTIDPDMFQVYHKDSKATSVNNWGYPAILRDKTYYSQENVLLDKLAILIDNGRSTNDQSIRAAIYSQALDIVMQLAIELPTYQREDLFGYNTDKIDESTLNSDLSSYSGLTDRIWNLKVNEYR